MGLGKMLGAASSRMGCALFLGVNRMTLGLFPSSAQRWKKVANITPPPWALSCRPPSLSPRPSRR